MAKKDEFDLDDVDFDDFDIDIPEFNDGGGEKDDRKPVTKLAAGFKEGLKSSVANKDMIKRSVGQALPRGYGQALNAADAVSESMRETYDSVSRDLQPMIDSGRRAAGKISEKVKRKLPKKIAEALENFANGGQSGSSYNAARAKQESEDSMIAQAMEELFSKQASQQAELYKEEKTERTLRDAVDKKRHDQEMNYQAIVAKGVSRLVGYQDSIQIKFQQKQLELQYRHFFVAKDLLERTSLHQDKMIEAMEKVIKNTALPEAVKITQSEVTKQMLKERMAGAMFKNVANWTKDWREKFASNAKDYIAGMTSGIAGMADQGGSLSDTMGAARGTGFVAGNMLGDKLHDWGSNLLAPYLEKHQGLRRTGAKVGNFLSNAPRKMNRWAREETDERGVKGFFLQLLKDLSPRFGLDDELSNKQVLDADRPATFDNLTRRSIVEIIPGYLAQINRWVKASATGKIDSEDEMTVYNLEKGRFTSRSDYLMDIKRRVMPASQVSSARNAIDSLLADLTKGSNISSGAMRALRKKILSDVARGEPFDPRDLTMGKFYKDVDPEYVDELRYFFRNRFRVTEDGYLEQSAEDLDELHDLTNQFNEIGNLIPDPANYIRELQDVHGRANFDRLGYTSRVGQQEMLNYGSIFDDLLEDREIGTIDGTDYSAKSNDGRRPKRARSANPGQSKITARTSSSSEAIRAVNKIESSDLERYLGEESLVIAELRQIKDRVATRDGTEADVAIVQMLAQIVDRLESMGGEGIAGKARGTFDRAKKATKSFMGYLAKSPFKLGFGAAKLYAQGYVGAVKFAGKSAWGMVKGAGTATKDFGKWAFGRGKELSKDLDYYVRGRAYPALRAELLARKEYYDVNTRKWVDSFDQITGEVKDRSGKVILSASEFAQGLVTQHGKKVKTRIRKAFGALGRGVGGLISGGFKLQMMPLQMAFGAAKMLAKNLFGAGKDMISGGIDYFLKGETSPRLLNIKLEQGAYFDTVTKRTIKRLSDIKGDVAEYVNGKVRIVVKKEELQRSGGFFDYMGRKIAQGGGLLFKGAGFAAKVAWGAFKMPYKVMGAMAGAFMGGFKKRLSIKGIFSRFRSSGDKDQDMISIGLRQLELQERILNHLEEALPKRKRVLGDVDGDGVREGSYLDRLKRKAMGKAGDKDDKKGGRRRRRGRRKMPGKKAMTNLASKAGGWGSKLMAVLGMGAGSGGTAATAAGATTAATTVGTQAGRSALGTAARFVGRQLLWGGLRMAAGAVLGFVGAPVLLGAAAVAAVVGGGYLIYRHFANKPTPIRGMRYAQYGIKPNDPDQVEVVGKLEDMLVEQANYAVDGTATIDINKLNPQTVLEMFKINPQDDEGKQRLVRLNQWSKERFQPVLMAHLTAAKRLAPNIAFKDLDDKMPAKVALDFINSTRMDNMAGVYDNVEVSPFEDELPSDAGTVKEWVEKAREHFQERVDKGDGDRSESDRSTLEKVNDFVKGSLKYTPLGLAFNARDKVVDAAKGLFNKIKDSKFFKGAMSMGRTLVEALPGGKLITKSWDMLGNIISKVTEDKSQPDATLDALTAGRYRCYGAKRMHPDVVQSLYGLEQVMWDHVTYDGKQAVFNGSQDEVYPLVAKLFDLDEKRDPEFQAKWFVWFSTRFMPVFLQFCTSVRSRQSIDAREASTKLTAAEQYEVLKELVATTTVSGEDTANIWEVDVSPWKDHGINVDMDSVQGNLDELKVARKDKDYRERTAAGSNVMSQVNEARKRGQLDADESGMTAAEREAKAREDKSWWDKAKDWTLGEKGADGKRDSWFGTADPNAVADPNAPPLKGGAVFAMHPGGGTGGDINDIPAPTGAGWEGSKATIIAAAKMAGVDPFVAANVASIESRFNPNAQPIGRDGKPLSSAKGYFQFIDGTWKDMLRKYGSKYGIASNASPFDGRANALMGMEFLKENAEAMKKTLNREITDVDLYAAHFLGAGGAKRLLAAPPGADARHHVADGVPKANQSVFYERNGQARTVSGVYQELSKRMKDAQKHHTALPGQSYAQLLGEEDVSQETPTETVSTDAAIGSAQGVSVAETAPPPAPSASSVPPMLRNPTVPSVSAEAATAPTGDMKDSAAPSMEVASATAQVKSSAAAADGIGDGLEGVADGVDNLTGVNVSMDQKLGIIASLLQKQLETQGVPAKEVQKATVTPSPYRPQKVAQGTDFQVRNTRNKNV